MPKLTDGYKSNKPYHPPYKPNVSDPRRGCGREDFMDLLIMEITTHSVVMTEVASENPLKEEATVSIVIFENLMGSIKFQPNDNLGPPPDQSIEIRTIVLIVTCLTIIWLNNLNMIVPQLVHLKNTTLFTIPDISTSYSSSVTVYNYITEGEERQDLTEYLNA